jgi:tRNA wybutosine-synthesizing protein 1
MIVPLLVTTACIFSTLWVLWYFLTKRTTQKGKIAAPTTAPPSGPAITIFYATESGTSREVAEKVKAHFPGSCVKNAATLDIDTLSQYPLVVFVVSSYQDGTPPPSCEGFAASLDDFSKDFRVSADAWSKVQFAVFGNGSRNYAATYFNGFAKTLHDSLLRKAGKPLLEPTLSDEATTVSDVRTFIRDLRKALTGEEPPAKKVSKKEAKEDDKETDLDIEDMANGEVATQMLNPRLRAGLTKQGYSLFGTHSGVKLCRWTKSMIRGRGGCYKHTFYGISSLSCMEMTPSLACANKCVFCWRHHTNPTTREWRWDYDPPEFLLSQALANHAQMVKALRGVPGVTPEKMQEAERVRHCALSLVGEPILYPEINKLVGMMHEKGISSFMVTNAQFPDRIEQLKPVTQLYVSIDAGNAASLKAIDRPIFEDFWERYLECIKRIAEKKQRTVFRLTLVKKYNLEEIDDYSKLVLMGRPDFIEVKGVTFCGDGGSGGLTMENVPFHEEVMTFCKQLEARISDRYAIACEHEHSCCILLAKREFRNPDGGWNTWIDYEKFFKLATSGEPFTSRDYMAPTPHWAAYGADEKGFDPLETRHRRKEKGPKLGGC